jgi:hypothetical protein
MLSFLLFCSSLHADVNILLNATGFEVWLIKKLHAVVLREVVGNGAPLFIVLSAQVYTVRCKSCYTITFPSLPNSVWSLLSSDYSTLRFKCSRNFNFSRLATKPYDIKLSCKIPRFYYYFDF